MKVMYFSIIYSATRLTKIFTSLDTTKAKCCDMVWAKQSAFQWQEKSGVLPIMLTKQSILTSLLLIYLSHTDC